MARTICSAQPAAKNTRTSRLGRCRTVGLRGHADDPTPLLYRLPSIRQQIQRRGRALPRMLPMQEIQGSSAVRHDWRLTALKDLCAARPSGLLPLRQGGCHARTCVRSDCRTEASSRYLPRGAPSVIRSSLTARSWGGRRAIALPGCTATGRTRADSLSTGLSVAACSVSRRAATRQPVRRRGSREQRP
jgi:hypothetical protein